MSNILIAIIQTIVIAITNINTRNTISIITGKQIAEACSTLALAILRWFIGTITAIIVPVAIPSGRNASMIRAPETILWTCALRAMQRVLIGIVAAIVIAIAKPIRLHANVRLFAFQVICGAGSVLRTAVVCLVRCHVVFAIIHPITNLQIILQYIISSNKFVH